MNFKNFDFFKLKRILISNAALPSKKIGSWTNRFTHFFSKNPDKFDFILSNPPYLTSSEYRNLSKDVKDYEPKQALVGGFDGILYYKKIISFSKSSLKKNGFLALEIGDGQYKEIKKLLTNHSFRVLDKYQLIDGEIRCILASKI